MLFFSLVGWGERDIECQASVYFLKISYRWKWLACPRDSALGGSRPDLFDTKGAFQYWKGGYLGWCSVWEKSKKYLLISLSYLKFCKDFFNFLKHCICSSTVTQVTFTSITRFIGKCEVLSISLGKNKIWLNRMMYLSDAYLKLCNFDNVSQIREYPLVIEGL